MLYLQVQLKLLKSMLSNNNLEQQVQYKLKDCLWITLVKTLLLVMVGTIIFLIN